MSCCRQSGLAEHCSRYYLLSLERIRPIIVILITLVLASAVSGNALAASVSLAWDANEPTPDGYIILIRTDGSSYNYDAPVWVGTSTSCHVDGLIPGTTYSMVVRAYNSSGQSADSNEVTFVATDTGPDTAGRDNTSSEAEKDVQALNSTTGRDIKADDKTITVTASKVSYVTHLTFSPSK